MPRLLNLPFYVRCRDCGGGVHRDRSQLYPYAHVGPGSRLCQHRNPEAELSSPSLSFLVSPGNSHKFLHSGAQGQDGSWECSFPDCPAQRPQMPQPSGRALVMGIFSNPTSAHACRGWTHSLTSEVPTLVYEAHRVWPRASSPKILLPGVASCISLST